MERRHLKEQRWKIPAGYLKMGDRFKREIGELEFIRFTEENEKAFKAIVKKVSDHQELNVSFRKGTSVELLNEKAAT